MKHESYAFLCVLLAGASTSSIGHHSHLFFFANAWTTSSMTATTLNNRAASLSHLFSSHSTRDEFAAFAASLEEDDDQANDKARNAAPQQQQQPRKAAAKRPASSNSSRSRAGTTTSQSTTTTTATTIKTTPQSWQDDLDNFLDPTTPTAKRQVLLQNLLSANGEIRLSVEAALRNRKIDPLLTPRGKRLQEGSRAVARQLTTDILPLLIQRGVPPTASTFRNNNGSSGVSSARGSSGTATRGGAAGGSGVDITKVGSRILNALTNQVQSNLQTLQEDLANPRRIPARLDKQRTTLWQEAANVFAETPAGLAEPPYSVVKETADYEIRDYEAYTVASTSMTSVEDMGAATDPAMQGAAFNSLAAYLFGANRQQQVLNMTTPVTTTMSGDMRFYLATSDNVIPEPLEEDEAKSVYETDRILIQEIPPCRLAVRRFPGFATEGEIRRQKKALLTALELDQVELDVPHGEAIPHVLFQYNPPYTLPVVRRNEIAVAVLDETLKVEESMQQASPEDAWEDLTPSA